MAITVDGEVVLDTTGEIVSAGIAVNDDGERCMMIEVANDEGKISHLRIAEEDVPAFAAAVADIAAILRGGLS